MKNGILERIPRTRAVPPRLLPILLYAAGALGVIAFVVFYPPANALLREVARIVFTIVFTPFVLEFVCIILGILIVITLNNRRLAKDAGDEWVYLRQVDPNHTDLGEIPEVLRKRIEDAPLVTEHVPLGARERVAEIAGFIDLEMADEAIDSLLDVPESEINTAPFLIQRIRLARLRGNEGEVMRLCDSARASGASSTEIAFAQGEFATE